MVFTLQGSYYWVNNAYSMYGPTDTRDTTCANWGGNDPGNGNFTNNRAAGGARKFAAR